MIRKFNTRLLFTDRDSLCYELHEKNPYKKMYKLYSILDESNNEKSTNKGHNAFIEFQEFDDTLFKKKILRHAMRGIKPKSHNLGIYETSKISLLCFDDKRYILKNRINTLAYGHKDI